MIRMSLDTRAIDVEKVPDAIYFYLLARKLDTKN